jgi:sensor histidine kinase YesM
MPANHLLLILFLITPLSLFSSSIEFKNMERKLIGQHVEILEDPTNSITPEEAFKSKLYKRNSETVPNLGLSNSTFWIKFSITTNSKSPLVFIIPQPTIDQIELYSFSKDCYTVQKTGEIYPFFERKYKTINYILDLKQDKNIVYLLKVKSREQLLLPMQISSKELALQYSFNKEIIFSFYIGIIFVMILYNIFIYLSVKDPSYIFYVLYIICVALTQTSFQGYAFKYFWPDHPYLELQSTFITPALVGVTTIPFFITFLQVPKYIGKIHYILYLIIFLYTIGIISSILNYYYLSYKIVEIVGILYCISLFSFAITIAKKGSQQAKFFLAAWSIFFAGIIVYALKDMGILPYNDFTNYTMPAGTAVEVVLLSLALADRINLLKNENAQKQNEIINHLHQTEKSLTSWKDAVLDSEKLKKESIRNQINPHFLFNSLNVLTDLLYENQEQAAQFVTQLSQVYRYVLTHKDEEVVKLRTEIEFIEAFIFLLKIRFGKNLIIENNIMTDDKKMIPPLTLQILIENAIKHNIITSEEPLTIKIEQEDDFIIVKNSIQFENSIKKSTGIGLNNIEERYKFLSDKKIDFRIHNNLFIVKVPLLEIR